MTAAGNLGKNPITGKTQYGGITAPGNAPWVLTVGAYSHEGTLTRTDDKMGALQLARSDGHRLRRRSRTSSPRARASCRCRSPGSLFYATKAAYLLDGTVHDRPTSRI